MAVQPEEVRETVLEMLTKKEREIFNILFEHRGHVVPRAMIGDRIDTGYSNVIDVHVKNMRRKIGSHYEIKTARGQGYWLV